MHCTITLKLQLPELLLVHKVTVQGLPEVIVSVAFLFLIAHVTKSMESTLFYAPGNNFSTLTSIARVTSKGKKVLRGVTPQWVGRSKGSRFLNLAWLKSVACTSLASFKQELPQLIKVGIISYPKTESDSNSRSQSGIWRAAAIEEYKAFLGCVFCTAQGEMDTED